MSSSIGFDDDREGCALFPDILIPNPPGPGGGEDEDERDTNKSRIANITLNRIRKGEEYWHWT